MTQKSQKMKQETEASNEEHKKQMDDLQHQFETEKKQMMEQKQKSLMDQKQVYEEQLRETDESHKAGIGALNKTIDTLTADIGQKSDELTKLQGSASDQKARNNALSDQINVLSHELEGLKAEKETLKQQTQVMTTDIEQKSEEFTKNQDAISALQSSVTDQTKRNEALNAQVNDFTQEIDRLKAQIDEKQAKNDQVIAAHDEQNKEHEFDLAELRRLNTDLEREINGKRMKEAQMVAAQKTQKRKHKSKVAKITQLKKELDAQITAKQMMIAEQNVQRNAYELEVLQLKTQMNAMNHQNVSQINVNESLINEYKHEVIKMSRSLEETKTKYAMKERELDAGRHTIIELKQDLLDMKSAAKEQELEWKYASKQQELTWEREKWQREQKQTKEQTELAAVKTLLNQLETSAAQDKEETERLRKDLRNEEDRLNALLLEKQEEIKRQAEQKRKEQEDKLRERSAKRNAVLRRQQLNTNNFEHWKDSNDLLDWIMGLDGGKFEKFEDTLGAYLDEKNISGQYLYQHDVTVHELRDEWGMGEDAASLLVNIKYLKYWNDVRRCMNRYAKSKGKRLDMKIIDRSNIRAVLVLSIGIAEYDRDTGYGPLPDIVLDLRRYKDTFVNDYGYTLISNDDYDHRNMNKSDGTQRAYYLSDTELYELLLEARRKLFASYDQTQLLFDGLIITISSHGVSKGIVCSDGSILTYKEIQKIFSGSTLDRIPKVYIVDACREEVASETTVVDFKETEDEEAGSHAFSITLFADGDGKSVRGGLLSEHMMHAFEANIENKNGFYQVVIQATEEMKQSRGTGGPILRIGGDYVAGSMDKVVFVQNMSRGREKNPLRNVDDDLINFLSPQKGGSGGAKKDFQQYYRTLYDHDAGFQFKKDICTLTKKKLSELGVKVFHQKELLRRVEELRECTDVNQMEKENEEATF
eukprot:52758_1